jgi:hypothetical protein
VPTKLSPRIEALHHVPEDGKAEIVGGRLVRMSPTGARPGRAAMAIALSLREHERKHGVVKVYRAEPRAMPRVYRRGDVAEAEPAVPGWQMPVGELFE